MIEGCYNVIHRRNGQVLKQFEARNLITTVGIHRLMQPLMTGVTPAPETYLGIFDDSVSPIELSVQDEYTNNAGWDEFTHYIVEGVDELERAPWNPTADSTDRKFYNNDPAVMLISWDEVTIMGAFVCFDSDTIGGTGVIFSEALFPEPLDMVAGDELLLNYTVTFPPNTNPAVPPYNVTQVILEGNE